MIEKRFVCIDVDYGDYCYITDNGKRLSEMEIVNLLNEQQDIILQLKEENEKFVQNKCLPCELVSLQTREIDKLKDENEQLKFENKTLKFNYQKEIQTSIDFCNDYSKTNGELLEEIDKLEKQNEQLREINKELGDDLYDCRLNKNIISEKLKLLQDTLIEYDIYTIKDLYESFELDAKINKEKDDKIKELQVKVLNLELELMKNE